jgi:hypothetical protein
LLFDACAGNVPNQRKPWVLGFKGRFQAGESLRLIWLEVGEEHETVFKRELRGKHGCSCSIASIPSSSGPFLHRGGERGGLIPEHDILCPYI